MSILQGEKIQLKPTRQKDLPILWELIYGEDEPEFKKWDAPYFPLEKVSLQEFEKNMIQRLENEPESQRLIVVNGEIIGTVTYYWEHKPSNWMEVGIIIYNPVYWNGGYGTEAIKIWIEYLFKTFPHIPRIGYTTWSGNYRMIKVGQKLGMKEEARIRKARLYNETYYDSVKMGILREEWELQSI